MNCHCLIRRTSYRLKYAPALSSPASTRRRKSIFRSAPSSSGLMRDLAYYRRDHFGLCPKSPLGTVATIQYALLNIIRMESDSAVQKSIGTGKSGLVCSKFEKPRQLVSNGLLNPGAPAPQMTFHLGAACPGFILIKKQLSCVLEPHKLGNARMGKRRAPKYDSLASKYHLAVHPF